MHAQRKKPKKKRTLSTGGISFQRCQQYLVTCEPHYTCHLWSEHSPTEVFWGSGKTQAACKGWRRGVLEKNPEKWKRPINHLLKFSEVIKFCVTREKQKNKIRIWQKKFLKGKFMNSGSPKVCCAHMLQLEQGPPISARENHTFPKLFLQNHAAFCSC